MKKTLIGLVVLQSLIYSFCYGQVAINKDGSPPNENAILDLSSNNKGLLVPRMDSNSRKAIANTAGLIVYDSTVNSFFLNDGKSWKKTKHYIGEAYLGGIVFFVDSSGEHGLIASRSDIGGAGASYQLIYNSTYYGTDVTATGVYSGEVNTIMMVLQDPATGSAKNGGKVCYNYTITENSIVYGGWFLPSKEELRLMLQQRNVIGNFNYFTGYPWFSSSFSPGGLYAKSVWGSYASGSPQVFNAADLGQIRPVRKF